MESKGKLILLLVAGLVVAFVAIIIYNRIGAPPPAPEPVKEAETRIIISHRDIPPGTFVQIPQDMDWQIVPPESIKEDYLREGVARLEDFNGAVVRKPIHAGEPVTQSSLMKAGEGGFMSAVLEPGMRAVSVAVNATSGNAGFVSPGDRIDLIVTRHVKAGSEEALTSEIFVRNVRVVAVDQQLDNPENKAILAKTITVEVTPRQAEQVAVATEMGKISIALRSLIATPEKPKTDDVATEDKDNPDKKMMTDLYGTPSESTAPAQPGDTGFQRVRVFRGDQIENVDVY